MCWSQGPVIKRFTKEAMNNVNDILYSFCKNFHQHDDKALMMKLFSRKIEAYIQRLLIYEFYKAIC